MARDPRGFIVTLLKGTETPTLNNVSICCLTLVISGRQLIRVTISSWVGAKDSPNLADSMTYQISEVKLANSISYCIVELAS